MKPVKKFFFFALAFLSVATSELLAQWPSDQSASRTLVEPLSGPPAILSPLSNRSGEGTGDIAIAYRVGPELRLARYDGITGEKKGEELGLGVSYIITNPSKQPCVMMEGFLYEDQDPINSIQLFKFARIDGIRKLVFTRIIYNESGQLFVDPELPDGQYIIDDDEVLSSYLVVHDLGTRNLTSWYLILYSKYVHQRTITATLLGIRNHNNITEVIKRGPYDVVVAEQKIISAPQVSYDRWHSLDKIWINWIDGLLNPPFKLKLQEISLLDGSTTRGPFTITQNFLSTNTGMEFFSNDTIDIEHKEIRFFYRERSDPNTQLAFSIFDVETTATIEFIIDSRAGQSSIGTISVIDYQIEHQTVVYEAINEGGKMAIFANQVSYDHNKNELIWPWNNQGIPKQISTQSDNSDAKSPSIVRGFRLISCFWQKQLNETEVHIMGEAINENNGGKLWSPSGESRSIVNSNGNKAFLKAVHYIIDIAGFQYPSSLIYWNEPSGQSSRLNAVAVEATSGERLGYSIPFSLTLTFNHSPPSVLIELVRPSIDDRTFTSHTIFREMRFCEPNCPPPQIAGTIPGDTRRFLDPLQASFKAENSTLAYDITSVNSSGNPVASNTFTIVLPRFFYPEIIPGGAVTLNSIELNVINHSSSTTITNAEIQRSIDNSTFNILSNLNLPANSSTQYLDPNLQPSTIYYYRIKFLDTNSHQSTIKYSNTLEIRTLDEPLFDEPLIMQDGNAPPYIRTSH